MAASQSALRCGPAATAKFIANLHLLWREPAVVVVSMSLSGIAGLTLRDRQLVPVNMRSQR
jgi:hypothetical protein